MLLADAVSAYIADRHGRGEIGPNTARQVRWRLAGLCDAHPGLDLAGLDREAVAAWQHTIGGQRPASRRAYQSTLRTFCAWALDNELIDANPTARLARIREPRHVPRALSAGQMARLLMVLPDDRARLIVLLMRQCGLRCIEVARLAVADYDPSAPEIRVVGKADNERVVPVLDDLAVMLDRQSAGRHPRALIVGIGAQRISRLVSEWMDEAGIKVESRDGVSAHALRHTAASNLLDACGNVRTVQAFLGHASLATTERYLRRADLRQMRAAMASSA